MTSNTAAKTASRIARKIATGALALGVVGGAAAAALGATAAGASTGKGPYHVVGTSGLDERSAPSASSTKLGTLSDGTTVYIACQAQGISYTTGGSPASDTIWDQLTNGDFVADYWVGTPDVGKFSPGIPRCVIAQVSVWNAERTRRRRPGLRDQPAQRQQLHSPIRRPDRTQRVLLRLLVQGLGRDTER